MLHAIIVNSQFDFFSFNRTIQFNVPKYILLKTGTPTKFINIKQQWKKSIKK